jgi:hypothetical protein
MEFLITPSPFHPFTSSVLLLRLNNFEFVVFAAGP